MAASSSSCSGCFAPSRFPAEVPARSASPTAESACHRQHKTEHWGAYVFPARGAEFASRTGPGLRRGRSATGTEPYAARKRITTLGTNACAGGRQRLAHIETMGLIDFTSLCARLLESSLSLNRRGVFTEVGGTVFT